MYSQNMYASHVDQQPNPKESLVLQRVVDGVAASVWL